MLNVKNPARSRPLSANVRRLMTMARESPVNPDVEKIGRTITAKDLLYCDMQGRIFMAAIGSGQEMTVFAPLFMNSQLAGVIDHSFSVACGMENDDISNLLQIPMLLKSPETIVDVILWLNDIASKNDGEESAGLAVARAFEADIQRVPASTEVRAEGNESPDIRELTARYEYAYWLGYIYRCECQLHDESSRMVYGAFSEKTMRKYYEALTKNGSDSDDITLAECALEICRRLDMLLIGKLWKKETAKKD